jgi:hypothetical protein
MTALDLSVRRGFVPCRSTDHAPIRRGLTSREKCHTESLLELLGNRLFDCPIDFGVLRGADVPTVAIPRDDERRRPLCVKLVPPRESGPISLLYSGTTDSTIQDLVSWNSQEQTCFVIC